MILTCIICKDSFKRPPSKSYVKHCSKKCLREDESYVARQRKSHLGKPSKKKGKSKYKTQEEKRLATLAQGRASYRANIETRLFYYRKLAQKRRKAEGEFTLQEWENVLKKQEYKCLFCKKTKKLTIDHIIPISKWEDWAKLNKPTYLCNNINNIQALCKSCNSRKSNKFSPYVNLTPNKLDNIVSSMWQSISK